MSDNRTVLFACAAAALLSAGLPAATKFPVPGYVYPCSMQAGTTARIIVGGDTLRGVQGAVVSGDGVKVTRVVHVPSFPRASGKTQVPWAKAWAEDILRGNRAHRELPPEAVDEHTDWPKCDWWANLDERDDIEMQVVCRFWYTPENYPQPTPALDQQIILDVEVASDAKPGMRELIVYDGASCGAPHPFFITKEPHVVEPFFVVPTNEFKKIGHPHVLHLPPNLPVQELPVVLDGQAWPGEVDEFKLRLKKGQRYTFEMIARELMPYQGDAVPGFFNPVMRLEAPSGKEIAFEDDFYYLPDPILSVVAPADGVYTLRIHDNLYRGRQDCVYIVRCYPDAPGGHSFTPQNRAFVCFPPPAAHQPPPPGDGVDIRTGTLDFPGRTIRHNFTVREPVTLQFELFARRLGSPIDGVIRLYGPLDKSGSAASAPLLAEWDDVDKFLAGTIPQAISDPRGSWTFLTPGEYCAAVFDRCSAGGDSCTYTLSISRLQPDFEVYSETSAFRADGRDATAKIRVVPLNGFTGEVTIEGNDEFECGQTVSSAEPGEVTFSPKKSDWKGLKLTQFYATATVGPKGKVIRRRVTPTDSAEQAFAYTHLVPQRAFFFCRPE